MLYTQTGFLAALPYVVKAFVGPAGGVLVDWLIKNKMSVKNTRRCIFSFGMKTVLAFVRKTVYTFLDFTWYSFLYTTCSLAISLTRPCLLQAHFFRQLTRDFLVFRLYHGFNIHPDYRIRPDSGSCCRVSYHWCRYYGSKCFRLCRQHPGYCASVRRRHNGRD